MNMLTPRVHELPPRYATMTPAELHALARCQSLRPTNHPTPRKAS